MSDYITEKQFAEQTKEIRKILTSFFIQRSGKEDLIYVDGQLMLQGDFSMVWNFNDDNITPCYTETWIRRFIEEKTKFKIIAVPFFNDASIPNYRIKFKDMVKGKLESEPSFCIETNDLLQAYWEVACNIAGRKNLLPQWHECSLNIAAKALFNSECILAINPDGTRKLFKYAEGDCIPVIKNNHIPIVLLDLPDGTKFYKRNEVNSEDADYDVIGPNDIAP